MSAPITVAYADPPYLGQGRKHYSKHHDEAHTWDDPETHRDLIGRLVAEYPDGWAMSCSSPSLRVLLPMCPEDVRIAAWVKPFHAFKKGVRPAYAWEPVIFTGGRNVGHPPPPKGGKATTPRDWVSANIMLRKGLTGAKPPTFCDWLFDLLGLRPGDKFVDLFPGTGGVMTAWEAWSIEDDEEGIVTDPVLSPVRRDALIRAHRAGHRYPALWNDYLRGSLVEAGLLERDAVGWRLTDAGVELARREEEGRG